MKKFLMMALVALTVCGASFAKTFVIDIADSTNGKAVTVTKDPYATDYKATPVVDVTSYFSTKPQKGDTIEVYYNITSDTDIKWLTMIVIDTSEKAKWWGEITNDYNQGISLKKGQAAQGVLKFKVNKAPVEKICVILMTNEPGDKKLTLAKSGVRTGSEK